MKKKIIFIIVVLLGIISFAFIPRPIVDSKIEEIVLMQANLDYGNEYGLLCDMRYTEDDVIECLAKYKEQGTLKINRGFAEKDVQVRLVFRTDAGCKEIIIGKETYCSDGKGFKHRILNEEQFKKDLFKACGYQEADGSFTKDEYGFVGTVIEETTSYMIVEPAKDKPNLYLGDKVKVEYETDHYDFLYGIGRRVVVYYKGSPEELPDGTKLLKSDNISTEGFREFELEVEPSNEKEKRLILSSKDIEGFTSFGHVSDTNLYYYGLDRVMITIKGWTMDLEKALESGWITLDGIVARANQDVANGIIEENSYDDGGSQVYGYPNFTIIKYHTLDGNRDVYIGIKDMDIEIKSK